MIVDLKVFSNVSPGVLDGNAGGDTEVEEEDSDASPSMWPAYALFACPFGF